MCADSAPHLQIEKLEYPTLSMNVSYISFHAAWVYEANLANLK